MTTGHLVCATLQGVEGKNQARWTPPAPTDIAGCLAGFELANSLRASVAQVRRNLNVVRAYLGACDIRDVRQISHGNIESYLVCLHLEGKTNKTIRNHAGSISCFCRWLVRPCRLLKHNPMSDVGLPRVEILPPNHLTPAEVAHAMDLARQHGIECEVAIAIHAGLRMSEMQRLRWRDIAPDRKTVTIPVAKGKRFRVVPLNAVVREALERQYELTGHLPYVFPGGRLDADGVEHTEGTWSRRGPRGRDKWLKLLAPLQEVIAAFGRQKKGTTGRGWHSMRHTFGTKAASVGLRENKIADWMGHRSTAMTRRYIHLAQGYDPDIEKLAT